MVREEWYAKSGGVQGLVISEKTGRTVAVSYDPKDAPVLAASLDLLRAAKDLDENGITPDRMDALHTAIRKAEEV